MTALLNSVAAQEEHGRVKDPLPTRPPRPHPQARIVLERFPAGAPRGSWPAEEFAAARRAEGTPAEVVMDLPSDAFLVVRPAAGEVQA